MNARFWNDRSWPFGEVARRLQKDRFQAQSRHTAAILESMVMSHYGH
jgi:hypothetical protein